MRKEHQNGSTAFSYFFVLTTMAGLAACSSTPKPQANISRNPQTISEAPELTGSERGQQISQQSQLLMQSKGTPAQAVTLTFDQVSKDLGIPRARLEQQARILANVIDTGRTPVSLCNDDDNQSSEKLCTMIDNFKSNGKAAAIAAANRDTSTSHARRVPVRPQHFAIQQGMGFGRLMKSVHREPAQRILAWSPRMLMTTGCPRNLSAVAIRKIETLLPSPVAQKMMEKLYEHASGCLKPDEEGFELTHLRQALLRTLWNDKAGARKSIALALTATDSSERARVLYWSGLLQNDPQQRQAFWKRLTDEYPLSFHALEVWQQQGQDPMAIFAKRPPFTLNRDTLGAEADFDASLRWLETLYIIGRVDAAQKLARWITREYKTDLAPSTMLYISLLKSGRSTMLNTITFFTRQVSENPVLINKQTLNILFPKPYFDIFDRAAPDTDTFLMLSVARQESAFNPRARSQANAQGLLQLLPSTARRMSGKRRNDLYNTEVNAALGGKFLGQLIDRFESVELALAGYNAGPGRVNEWKDRYRTNDLSLLLDLIPFKETRNYVSSILRNNYWYERLYRNDPGVLSSSLARNKQKRSEIVTRLVSAHSQAGMLSSRIPASENL